MIGKSLIGICLVQLWVGYEFVTSGWNKFVASPSFPSSLGANLKQMVSGQTGWYAGFVNNSVLPHASVFGYLIEWGEVLAAAALIAAVLVFLIVPLRYNVLHKAFMGLSILALAGIFIMSLNFFLAAGGPSPVPGQDQPFGEGVSFDFFLAVMSLILIGWNAARLMPSGEKGSRSK